jgi:hypothetical protein
MEVRYKALKIKIYLRRMSRVLFFILIKSPIWVQEKMKVDDVNPLSDSSILSFSEGKGWSRDYALRRYSIFYDKLCATDKGEQNNFTRVREDIFVVSINFPIL